MSGDLIPISGEQAKLGQEILKTLRGLGSFIGQALGSTPEDLVGYLGGDWLRVRRAENLLPAHPYIRFPGRDGGGEGD